MTEFNLQVSYKTPAQSLINVRAQDGEELNTKLQELLDNLPKISEVEGLLGAVSVVQTAFQPSAQAPATSVTQAPTGQAYGSPAAAPGRWVPDGGIPVCEHGPFVYNSGNKNGAVWEGYFCPAQKGDPSQHKPVFKPRQGWGK